MNKFTEFCLNEVIEMKENPYYTIAIWSYITVPYGLLYVKLKGEQE